MRILMIAPEPFLEPRGTPFSVYHRAKALVASGYEVDLLTYSIGKQVSLPGLSVYRTPTLPFIRKVSIGPSCTKLLLDLCLFLLAIRRLGTGQYRYIHTHEEAGLMGVLLAPMFKCKHLYDMHSDLSQQMSNFDFTRNPLLIGCVGWLQRLIVRRADAVIAICPDLERTVRRIDAEKQVFLIENVAVDEALPAAQAADVQHLRARLRLADTPVLLYTGTFENYQGIDILLKSIALVRAEFPDVRYVLVGGKPEQVEKQRLLAQELKLEDMVYFEGQHPLEEMPCYMALADILLSPRSSGTNTPLKLYTYLRSGVPILATSIQSHVQILTPDMAMLVPPTAEGLAQGAIEMLRDMSTAKKRGEYGRRFAEQQYSWDAFLEKNRYAYSIFAPLLEVPERHRPQLAF